MLRDRESSIAIESKISRKESELTIRLNEIEKPVYIYLAFSKLLFRSKKKKLRKFRGTVE